VCGVETELLTGLRYFMLPPKVSVVVVAYMAQDVISDCIDSLIKQTYSKEDYEIIIVVDDDDTFDAVKKYLGLSAPRIKIQRRIERGNIPSARNVGIHLSQGEIVAFTDSDCVVHECWIEKLCEEFKHLPSIAGVGGAVKPFSLDPVSRALALLNMVSSSGGERSFKKQLATSNAAYRKDVLIDVGGFDENASVGEDLDLYRRVIQQGHQVLYNPDIFVHHKHRMRLLDIFLWCYSAKMKSIYMLKKYKHYLSSVRQITPALTVLILLISVFILGLISTLTIILVFIILTYISVFLLFGRNEYFSGKVGAILPVVVLVISLGFLFGLIKGHFEYARGTMST
jgi:glycosyltransferase involved in cell wall biosynthesis